MAPEHHWVWLKHTYPEGPAHKQTEGCPGAVLLLFSRIQAHILRMWQKTNMLVIIVLKDIILGAGQWRWR